MPSITVSRIEPTNPVIASYVKTINNWNKEGHISIKENDNYKPFYAIYYDEHFLGASTIDFDKKKSLANIAILNGSINDHGLIQTKAIEELYNIANDTYNPKEIRLSYKRAI